MQSITLSECFRGAWRDTGRALQKMPLLILVIFVLLLAAECFRDRLQISSQLSAESSSKVVFGLFSFGIAILSAIVASILSVKVIRYSLFGDTPPNGDGALRRYLLLLLITTVGFIVFLLAAVAVIVGLIFAMKRGGFAHGSTRQMLTISALIYALAICAGIFVCGRLSLLFPHAAAGGKLLWRHAWQDTRGHFWVVIATFFLTTLPIMIVSGSLGFLRLYAVTHFDASGLTYDIAAFLSSAATVLSVVTAGACSAWVYRRFARELHLSAA